MDKLEQIMQKLGDAKRRSLKEDIDMKDLMEKGWIKSSGDRTRRGITRDIDRMEMRERAIYLRHFRDVWRKMADDKSKASIQGICREWARQLDVRLAAVEAETRRYDAEAKESEARMADHDAKVDTWLAAPENAGEEV